MGSASNRAWCRRRRQRIKRDVIVLKATLDHCAICGLAFDPERPYAHDLDHIDPAQKLGTVTNLFRWTSPDKGLAEFRKCRLLCRPCHKVHTRTQRATAV